jgi:hypothetical protein
MIPPALLLAVVMSGAAGREISASSPHAGTPLASNAERASRDSAVAAQQKGRYKKQGQTCEWDANDSGPNQCTPVTKGRFKKSGTTCTWAFNDVGPDQCRPPKGRWTKSGKKCVWRPGDTGPDQCDPRQPR